MSDGHKALSFDLAGMAASGTNCTNAGPGKLTCPVRSLAPGKASTLDVLVDTTGLAQGTTITGSATVTSTNAPSQKTSFSPLKVKFDPNGTIAGGYPRKGPDEHKGAPVQVPRPR